MGLHPWLSRSFIVMRITTHLPLPPALGLRTIDNYDPSSSWTTTTATVNQMRFSSSSTTSTSNINSNSSNKKEEEEDAIQEPTKKESLEETIRRMQSSNDSTTNHQTSSTGTEDVLRKAREHWSMFTEEVSKTWEELLRSGDRKDINKKLSLHRPEDTAEGDQPYTGSVDIMVIDEQEKLTAWERMQRRLAEAPIISDILMKSDELYEKSGAKQVKQKVDHLSEDAREAWETSQNPWVYRISSVYETITAETPESMAVAELRKLDPDFTLDDWKQDVSEHTLPKIMEWLLKGKINQLKPWLGDGVFQRIAAEITARQQEGVEVDTHVLAIMNSEILACEPDEVNKGSPIIVLHFMCQQINCVRKKSDGTIVEGSEDNIKANSYIAAFQREYNEEKAELNWKIVDFRFNGAIAYL